jgi:hypothetical protein
LKQESQELELFITPQVLPQDLSISHDFLDQDSQVFHALAKKVRLAHYYFMIEFSEELQIGKE